MSTKRFLLGFFGFGFLLALLISFSPSRAIWWDFRHIRGQGILIKLLVAAVLAAVLPAQRDRINYWHPGFLIGVGLGSVGLFFLKGLRVAGMARWPFQLLGTSIPEMGAVFWQTTQLNPLFASCLIPLVLMTFFISHPSLKWLSLGVSVGMMAFLVVAMFSSPSVAWFGRGLWAEVYLFVNLVVCAIATRLFFQVASDA